jgi:hypothetical protein
MVQKYKKGRLSRKEITILGKAIRTNMTTREIALHGCLITGNISLAFKLLTNEKI